MTKMNKGLVAALMALLLAVGTVASAYALEQSERMNERANDPATRPQVEQSSSRAVDPAATKSTDQNQAQAEAQSASRVAEVKAKKDRIELTLHNVTSVVAEGESPQVGMEAGATIKNTGKEPLDLRELRILLKDGTGRVAIPATITAGSDDRYLVQPGEKAQVTLAFAGLPHDTARTGTLQMVQVTPNGESPVAAIGIEVGCSWPPLKCWIKVTFHH